MKLKEATYQERAIYNVKHRFADEECCGPFKEAKQLDGEANP